MTTYTTGPYGQLLIQSSAPSGNKMLTTDGWVDKQQYDEALVALATGAGTSGVLVGVAYEPMQIGSLTVGGAGWESNGGVNNNEIKYVGTPSGANHWAFTAKINFSSTVSAKEIIMSMFLNDVEMACADAVFETRNGVRTATLNGCGVIAFNDVVSLKYKSPDGATVTIEKCRWMSMQMR